MLFDFEQNDFSYYVTRRKNLIKKIKQAYPDVQDGVIVLLAGFEYGPIAFCQEHNFYYLTGIKEPGIVLVLDMAGRSTLYVPDDIKKRALWVTDLVALIPENVQRFEFDEIIKLEGSCQGPFFSSKKYRELRERLYKTVQKEGKIFILNPDNSYEYIEQRIAIEQLSTLIPAIESCIVDISLIIAQMRRTKDMREIECLYKAIEITTLAHEAAAQAIKK